jgi:hypothetical protein
MIDKFGLDAAAFGAITDTSLFEGQGTTTLRLDKRVPYNASINGTSVPAYVTLREAKLTRISLLEQQQVTSGRNYWLATAIMKPVKMDVELVIDGETMSLQQFMKHVAQAASNSEMSMEEFLHNARRIGFNFEEGMPLFVQQFGANIEGFKALVENFKAAGAKDVISNIKTPGRIKAAYELGSGVPVTAFELGTVDRSKSPRNQGFLNLVDAQIEQFQRILSLRKEAKILREQLEVKKDLNQEQIKKINERSGELMNLSRQWASSWSGAQKRIVNDNGSYVSQEMYDPVSAPCGRFTIIANGAEVEIDLWSNSTRANNAESSSVTTVLGKPNPF